MWNTVVDIKLDVLSAEVRKRIVHLAAQVPVTPALTIAIQDFRFHGITAADPIPGVVSTATPLGAWHMLDRIGLDFVLDATSQPGILDPISGTDRFRVAGTVVLGVDAKGTINADQICIDRRHSAIGIILPAGFYTWHSLEDLQQWPDSSVEPHTAFVRALLELLLRFIGTASHSGLRFVLAAFLDQKVVPPSLTGGAVSLLKMLNGSAGFGRFAHAALTASDQELTSAVGSFIRSMRQGKPWDQRWPFPKIKLRADLEDALNPPKPKDPAAPGAAANASLPASSKPALVDWTPAQLTAVEQVAEHLKAAKAAADKMQGELTKFVELVQSKLVAKKAEQQTKVAPKQSLSFDFEIGFAWPQTASDLRIVIHAEPAENDGLTSFASVVDLFKALKPGTTGSTTAPSSNQAARFAVDEQAASAALSVLGARASLAAEGWPFVVCGVGLHVLQQDVVRLVVALARPASAGATFPFAETATPELVAELRLTVVKQDDVFVTVQIDIVSLGVAASLIAGMGEPETGSAAEAKAKELWQATGAKAKSYEDVYFIVQDNQTTADFQELLGDIQEIPGLALAIAAAFKGLTFGGSAGLATMGADPVMLLFAALELLADGLLVSLFSGSGMALASQVVQEMDAAVSGFFNFWASSPQARQLRIRWDALLVESPFPLPVSKVSRPRIAMADGALSLWFEGWQYSPVPEHSPPVIVPQWSIADHVVKDLGSLEVMAVGELPVDPATAGAVGPKTLDLRCKVVAQRRAIGPVQLPNSFLSLPTAGPGSESSYFRWELLAKCAGGFLPNVSKPMQTSSYFLRIQHGAGPAAAAVWYAEPYAAFAPAKEGMPGLINLQAETIQPFIVATEFQAVAQWLKWLAGITSEKATVASMNAWFQSFQSIAQLGASAGSNVWSQPAVKSGSSWLHVEIAGALEAAHVPTLLNSLVISGTSIVSSWLKEWSEKGHDFQLVIKTLIEVELASSAKGELMDDELIGSLTQAELKDVTALATSTLQKLQALFPTDPASKKGSASPKVQDATRVSFFGIKSADLDAFPLLVKEEMHGFSGIKAAKWLGPAFSVSWLAVDITKAAKLGASLGSPWGNGNTLLATIARAAALNPVEMYAPVAPQPVEPGGQDPGFGPYGQPGSQ